MDTASDRERLAFGNFRLESRAGRLFRQNPAGEWMPVSIGPRALGILRVLLRVPGAVVSKDTIMDEVWAGVAVEPNNLTVQIAALRHILDEGRSGESCIQTVPGKGYRLDLGVRREAETESDLPAVPVAAPAVSPQACPQESGTIRLQRRFIAATGAVAFLALLLVAVWYGGWLSGTRAPQRLSLVVLPFINLSGDPKEDYLADGITDGLTTALAHIGGTFVISRSTAYTYRGKVEDIHKIGRDLDVRYIVRGSMQRFGQLLRVNAELASTETGAQLWSDNFEQSVADLAAGQEQIVIRMRSALSISLGDIEAARSLRERPTNPDAFDLILRANAIWALPETRDTLRQILRLYEQARERDPNAVLALTGAVVTVLELNFLDAMPFDAALDRATQYLARAQALAPNSEAVLVAQSTVLDWQGASLDWRGAHSEVKAVGQKLIDLYPNNWWGYFRLGVVARQEGRYEEAVGYLRTAIRLNPRGGGIKNLYGIMAYCNIVAGHDREGLEWADRAVAAPGDLALYRVRLLLSLRAVAYYRAGDVETAKRLVAELKEQYPLDTVRRIAPADPDSGIQREESQSLQHALTAAGHRDHLDPEADFGVPPDDALHEVAFRDLEGKTPTTAPGVTTVSTAQLSAMLEHDRPLVIDTMQSTWYRSVPGAVGLDFNFHTYGSFTDEVQKRLERKLQTLTGGDTAKPIVAVGFNVGHFDGYNLALRIRHAGYTNVYWYRGGREAWEVAGMPEEVVRPADW